MKNSILLFLILLFSQAGQGAVKTWSGSVDDRWDRNNNWLPNGVPGTGDIVILDGTGINTNITRFNATQLAQLTVSNANGNCTYSISSFGDGTLSITGGTGTDFDIQSGCSLTVNDHVMFTLGGGTTADIAGTLTFNQGFINHLITFAANSTTTLSGSIVFTGTGTGATIDIQYGALIEGNGGFTHTFGAMAVNGLIEIEGDINNSSPITGTGTIKTGGAWNNTSTMFSYPGNPPGEIISGYTWRGLTSTDWATGSNWWAGAVPVSTGDAVIYTAANLPLVSTAGQQCRRLFIHNEYSTVTISPAGQLTATGKTTLISDEGTPGTWALIIRSDATGTGSFIDNGTFDGIGVASVERFLEYGTSGQWHFIGIPVTQINAWTYYDQYMKYYDESTHHYKYVIASTADSLLNSDGLGYAMWANLADFTAVQNGTPNTGTMNIPVTRSYDAGTADYDGWNLVANPYTSAVDISLLTPGWTNTEPSAWFWDGPAGNFKVYPSGGGGSHSQYCPVGQGFFVHCNDASATPVVPGSGTVVMTNAARVHSTESFLKGSMADILRVTARGAANAYNDELSIYFAENLTDGYDPGHDARKMAGDALAPQIYTRMGEYDLSVNALPFPEEEWSVTMGFRAGQPGSYMLTASETESFPPDIEITLEDLKEGIVRNLRADPDYAFSHDPASDPDRFRIRFSARGLGSPEPAAGGQVTVYTSGGQLVVSGAGSGSLTGRVQVYDLLGRTLTTKELTGQAQVSFPVPSARGYCVVRVVTAGGTTVKKVYLD